MTLSGQCHAVEKRTRTQTYDSLAEALHLRGQVLLCDSWSAIARGQWLMCTVQGRLEYRGSDRLARKDDEQAVAGRGRTVWTVSDTLVYIERGLGSGCDW